MKLSPRVPAYNHLLKLGTQREGAILLDIGCCCELPAAHDVTWVRLTSGLVGNDVRKAVADGFPVHNVVATDIHPGQ